MSITTDLYERLDDGIRPDQHICVDNTTGRIKDGHPFRHEFMTLGRPHALINLHQFGAAIGPQDFSGIVHVHREYVLF